MRDGGVVAEHKYKRMASICYVGVAAEATEPPHAPRNTSRASATTTALHPADQHPRPRVSNYLPAAGGHRPPSTASSPAAATYGARAGRAPPTDQKLALCPLNGHPPPLHRASPQPRVRAGSAETSSAPRSCSLGRKAPHLGRKSARGEFAIRRRSHSPAPSTCSTATHRSIKLVAPGAR